MQYRAIVVGLGGMGSASLAHIAKRGATVLGIERFHPIHEFGASSGKSRIIRRAYFENHRYVPLLHRAYDLWRNLERDSGTRILHANGLLTAGFEGSAMLEGARRAVERYGLDAELWTAADIRARYPALRPRAEESGVFERDGGFLVPEAAVSAYLADATSSGAQTVFGAGLQRWEPTPRGIVVKLSTGHALRCDRLILTLGPWFKEELARIGMSLTLQRNVQAWFGPPNAAFGPDAVPTFLLERRGLPALGYGFPDIGDGVKAALHAYGAPVENADALDRSIDTERDVAPIAAMLEDWLPGAGASIRDAKACMYALTADRDFAIDRHPLDDRVVLCGGFSGHGFKFASVVGEIAAGLALDGESPHRIDFLSLERLRSTAKAG